MELLQLKYFCRAAETENFAKTAEEFGVPRTSISQAIKRLEEELGKKLFDRRTNGVYLNEQGNRIYLSIKPALTMLNDAKKEINDDEVSGHINLLAISARAVVLNAVKKYCQEYPNVSFTIDYDLNGSLKDYDLVITDNMSYAKEIAEIELLSDKMFLAVSKEHHLSKKKNIYIEDLKHEKFVTYGKNNGLYHQTKAICNLKNFDPDVAIYCDEIDYILKCVELNIGISLVPSLSWKDFITDNISLRKIIDIPVHFTEKETAIYYNREKYISTATKLFINTLVETGKKYK